MLHQTDVSKRWACRIQLDGGSCKVVECYETYVICTRPFCFQHDLGTCIPRDNSCLVERQHKNSIATVVPQCCRFEVPSIA